jgi:DUF4097 and DUF4098 domain-containing protein YvlB
MNNLRKAMLAALLLPATHTIAGEAIDETRDVDADAIIDINIMNGDVTLTGWDENRFHISGELSEAADSYELREINGGIRFEEDLDRRSFNNCWAWGNRCNQTDWADLEVQLPRGSVLRFEGTNIEVTVEGLNGSVDIEVVNGDIYASDLRGTIQLETVNGDIDTRRLNGRVSLETVNGGIDDSDSEGSRLSLNTVNGDIRTTTTSARIAAETTNGDIELDAGALDELEVSTIGGRVEASATLNDQGRFDMSSVSGRIELTVPLDTSARFNVTTSVGGRIDNELSADEAERKNRYVNSRELDFTLGDGGGDVSISTVSGNVTLRGE